MTRKSRELKPLADPLESIQWNYSPIGKREKYLHIGVNDLIPSDVSRIVTLVIAADRRKGASTMIRNAKKIYVYYAVKRISSDPHNPEIERFSFEVYHPIAPELLTLMQLEREELKKRAQAYRLEICKKEEENYENNLPWWSKLKNMIFGG